jgi:hypothetical protein
METFLLLTKLRDRIEDSMCLCGRRQTIWVILNSPIILLMLLWLQIQVSLFLVLMMALRSYTTLHCHLICQLKCTNSCLNIQITPFMIWLGLEKRIWIRKNMRVCKKLSMWCKVDLDLTFQSRLIIYQIFKSMMKFQMMNSKDRKYSTLKKAQMIDSHNISRKFKNK